MSIPGMITHNEVALIKECTHQGDVVNELGCFLGMSTNAFLEGGAGRVNSYDRFIWEAYMDRCWNREKLPEKPGVGDNFRRLTEQYLAPHGNKVALHEVNLNTFDGPTFSCDILFVDAIKAHWIGSKVIPTFFPTANRYIIDQDFWWNPSVYMYMWCFYYHMSRYLQPVAWADNMIVFQVTHPLSRFTLQRYSIEDVQEAIAYFMEFKHSKCSTTNNQIR